MLKRNRTLIFPASQLLVLSLFLLASPARAEGDRGHESVARVSLIHGDVAVMRGDTQEWAAAVVNTPLVVGDALSTGDSSQAEIQLDYAHVLRLAEHAQVKIANLTDNQIQLQLAQGLAGFVTLWKNDSEVEVDTPNAAVRPLGEGAYRLHVASGAETSVTVLRGAAAVAASGGSANLDMGQQMIIRGTDQAEYEVQAANSPDDWDHWNQDRDREIIEAQSWQHADTRYTGANDLDRYGHWVFVPGYGWCWTPYVTSADWVPYLDGRWVWEPYWGWTWVSYEPWGWAPYHYGRWFVSAGAWVWWPGPVAPAYRPVYAPAYVSFLGFGFGEVNWSFGPGFGYERIGWLPVGPSDDYHPWWGQRTTYSVMNIAQVTNAINDKHMSEITVIRSLAILATRTHPVQSNLQAVIANVQVRCALVMVPTENFAKGQVPRRAQLVDIATLDQADIIRGTIPVVPTRESLQPVNRAVNRAAVPAHSINTRQFFTQRTPAPPPRPFAEHAAEIQQMLQRTDPLAPLSRTRSLNRTASGNSEGRSPGNSAAGKPEAQAGTRAGWRHFGNATPVQPSYSPAGNQDRKDPSVSPGDPGRPSPAAPGRSPEQGTESAAGTGSVTRTEGKVDSAPQGSGAGSASVVGTRPGWHRFGENNQPRVNSRSEKAEEERLR